MFCKLHKPKKSIAGGFYAAASPALCHGGGPHGLHLKGSGSLSLSQPHLSLTISELEKELGITDFHRNNRGVTHTEEGAVFLSYARSIVNQINNLERMYVLQKKIDRKPSASPGPSSHPMDIPVQLINKLPSAVPVNIHMMEGSHLDVIQALVAREADMGVIIVPEEAMPEYEHFARRQAFVTQILRVSNPISYFLRKANWRLRK